MLASSSFVTSCEDAVDGLGQHRKSHGGINRYPWAVSQRQSWSGGYRCGGKKKLASSRIQDDKLSMVLPQSGGSRG
jgi:hypothetical protein